MDCQDCGNQISEHWLICPSCGHATTNQSSQNTGIVCFFLDPEKTRITNIFQAPDLNSPVLYEFGVTDLVPIIGEDNGFYKILLPGDVAGFIKKDFGHNLEIGIGDLSPLGFYRRKPEVLQERIETPGGWLGTKVDYKPIRVLLFAEAKTSSLELAEVSKEARLPVIADSGEWLKVQLPNRIRGFVQKGYGIRTLAADSLPESSEAVQSLKTVLSAVGIIAIAAIAGISKVTMDSIQSSIGYGRRSS